MTLRRAPVVALVALAVLLVAAPLPALARPTVEATGEGEVSLPPDLAMLSLGVTTDAPTAKEALENNARAMTAVVAALAQAGFAAPDVATRAVSLTPLMDHRQGAEPKIVAYRANNTVQVKTKDPASIGRALEPASGRAPTCRAASRSRSPIRVRRRRRR